MREQRNLNIRFLSLSSSLLSFLSWNELSEIFCSYIGLICGLGGLSFLLLAWSQFIDLKKGWFLISSESLGPAPNRFLGFLLSNWTIKSKAVSDISGGTHNGPCLILSKSFVLLITSKYTCSYHNKVECLLAFHKEVLQEDTNLHFFRAQIYLIPRAPAKLLIRKRIE